MTSTPAPPPTCPRCHLALAHVERQGLVVELCPGCRGQWLDPGELTILVEIYKKLEAKSGAASGIFCARCGDVELRELTFPGSGVPIDVCPQCQGVFLDNGELELIRSAMRELVEAATPELVDLATRAEALLSEAERASEQRFRCPKCDAKLWHLDRAGTVVELCSGCRGMWFDGGELTVLLGVYRRLEADGGAATELECLRCQALMRALRYPETQVEIDVCGACQGVFLDRGELEALEASVAAIVATHPEHSEDLETRARALFDDLDLGAKQRAACPKCGGSLTVACEGGVRAEYCMGCAGTWLDSGDLTRAVGVSRRLKAKEGEEVDVLCVRCPGQKLVELRYPGTEVQIDLCPDCRGVWLDKGEAHALRRALQT